MNIIKPKIRTQAPHEPRILLEGSGTQASPRKRQVSRGQFVQPEVKSSPVGLDGFLKSYFNSNGLLKKERELEVGVKPLLGHNPQTSQELKESVFQQVMSQPEIASQRCSWLLLLSNFVGKNIQGSEKPLAWIKLSDQDRERQDMAEHALLTYAFENQSLASKRLEVNAPQYKLNDIASIFARGNNIKAELKRNGVTEISNSGKLFILDALMSTLIYGDDNNLTVKNDADFTGFARAVNILSEIKTTAEPAPKLD